ncbi:MAG: response regulator [Myxococcota bacterium]
MRLLLLENHEVFAATITATFLSGHEVVHFRTVTDALAAVGERPFDVALVDYDLDREKGSTFIRKLRATGSALPVVAISAREEGNRRLLDAGAGAACTKLRFSSILSVVGELTNPQA